MTHLHRRRGWSRNAATAAVFAGLIGFVAVMIFVLIPGLVRAAQKISGQIPQWVDQINKTFGVRIDHGRSPVLINQDIQHAVHTWVSSHPTQLLDLASNTFGLAFQLLTIATFTFYLAAGAPKLLRVYLSHLTPERQQRVGWAWDNAVVQTGGYFYSRSVLMVANATLFFFVQMLVGVTWSLALPLAIFEAFMAEFIPIVGTYLGAAVPAIVTLGLVGLVPALILVGYVTVYQQIENYFLSPRLSAHAMDISGGVAFGAALDGGAIGGPMGAFMALPVAAMITAFIRHYGHTRPVVYRSAYDDPDDAELDQPDQLGTPTPPAGQRPTTA